jgi:hypothetical protein
MLLLGRLDGDEECRRGDGVIVEDTKSAMNALLLIAYV